MQDGTQDVAFAGEGTAHRVETAEIVSPDGTRIILRRMGGDAPVVRYVLSHGNGLAIEGYRPFWERLLPDAELVIFDFRNHGLNPPAPTSGLNNWVNFVTDFDAVLHGIEARFGAKPTYGIFHSMSALTCLLHASRHDWPWQGRSPCARAAFCSMKPLPCSTRLAAGC